MNNFGKLGRWWYGLMTFSLQPEHVLFLDLFPFCCPVLFFSCACIRGGLSVFGLDYLYQDVTL
jgi:hypothetical protein